MRLLPVVLWATSWSMESSGDPMRQLHAVVDTLQELLVTIEAEERVEIKNHEEYMDWCSSEKSQKKTELEELKLSQEDLQVIIDQSEASVSKNSYIVSSNMKEIKEILAAIQTAEAVRQDEKSQYDTDRLLNVQSIKQLDLAIKILDRQTAVEGLVQTGQKGKEEAPGESSFVVGVFRSLKQNMERNQQGADEDETRRKNLFDKLVSEQKALLKNLTTETEGKQILVAEMKQKAVQAKNDIKNNASTTTDADAYLKRTRAECKLRANEWKKRQADRQAEKDAIQEAIAYLKITFEEAAVKLADGAPANGVVLPVNPVKPSPSFLQLKKSSQNGTKRELPYVLKSLPSSFLNVAALDLASANSMLNLSTLSTEVRAFAKRDRFRGVKKKIKQLVKALKIEQKENKVRKDRCETVKEANEAELAQSQEAFVQITSLVDRKSEMVQTLSGAIAEIREMMEQSKKQNEEQITLRKSDHAAYKKSTKERKLALMVLGQAKKALQGFYDSKAALLQSHAPPPQQDKGADRHENESRVVLAMMDKIRDDVIREQEEADKEENEAQASFENQQRDAVKEYDERMERITERSIRRARTSVQLDNNREDKVSLKEKVTAIKGKLKALSNECVEFLKSYKKREDAIQFEIAQLDDAHDIFSGASEAVRTGMLR